MSDILPDSRLKDPKGTVMADWLCADGTTIRLELEPIFCAGCGKPAGYVPRDVMAWVTWLCLPCSDRYGEDASGMFAPDHQFWQDVAAEMGARFGRALTPAELWQLGEQGRLGKMLETLERESPYRKALPT